MKGQIQNSY